MSSRAPASSDLAFNLSLVAYDFQIPDRKIRQALTVERLVKQPQIAGLLAESDPVVPSLEAETIQDDGSIVGIWVGMRPSLVSEDGKQATKMRKGGSVNKNHGFRLIHQHLRKDYNLFPRPSLVDMFK